MKRKNIVPTPPAEKQAGPATPKTTAAAAKFGEPGFSLAFKTILVPLDFSKFSQRALDYAVPLARHFDASLVLLHVVEPQVYQESLIVGPDMEEINIKQMRLSREKIEALAAERVGAGGRWQTSVRAGKPYVEIIEAAAEFDVDLIVIATRGFTGLKHVFLGSNAERVVRLAPCPVLTVRDKEGRKSHR